MLRSDMILGTNILIIMFMNNQLKRKDDIYNHKIRFSYSTPCFARTSIGTYVEYQELSKTDIKYKYVKTRDQAIFR